MTSKETTIQYKEALRHIENVRDVLKTKAGKEGAYKVIKYVRMADRTAYTVALIATYLVQKSNGKVLA